MKLINNPDCLRKALYLFLAFVLLTVFVKFIGVRTVTPAEPAAGIEAVTLSKDEPVEGQSFSLGLAGLNAGVFKLLGGYHKLFETLTKLLGYASLAVVAAFAYLGMRQLIDSKSFSGVDRRIIILGIFYVIVLVCYVLFEKVIINYRPVILDEGLEASYPSSHTMLVIAVMATAPAVGADYLRGKPAAFVKKLCPVLIGVMIVGRMLAGVHWLTDIIGGVLIAYALVSLWRAFDTEEHVEKFALTAIDLGGRSKRSRGGAHLK